MSEPVEYCFCTPRVGTAKECPECGCFASEGDACDYHAKACSCGETPWDCPMAQEAYDPHPPHPYEEMYDRLDDLRWQSKEE